MLRAGGTGLIQRFYEEMQGPTKQAVLRWTKSKVSIKFEGIQEDLIANADQYFIQYFGYKKIPVQISFDATAILPKPCYHKITDKMVGGTTISEKIGNNPNVIIEYAKQNQDTLCKQFMLIMASPTTTPKLIGKSIGVELMSKGCKSSDAKRWIEAAITGFAELKSRCVAEVVSSDGDSGARKYFEDTFINKDVDGISLSFPSFTYKAVKIAGQYTTCVPDMWHMEKKKRNNGMNARRMLKCGKYVMYARHVEYVQQNCKFRIFLNDQSCGLLNSDVRPRDKQDWKPVYKLSRPAIREALKTQHAPYQATEFTIVFLQYLDNMIQAAHYDDIHPLVRIKLLWEVFEFYKHWLCWLKSKQLPRKCHFISWQLMHDTTAYAHSIPLLALTRNLDKDLWELPFSFRSCGTDQNEKAFGGVRTQVKGQYHVTAVKCAELLEKVERVRELMNETGVDIESNKKDSKTAHGRSFKDLKQHQTDEPKSLKDWFGNIDQANLKNQIITSLGEAKKKARQTIASLGVDLNESLFLEQVEIFEKSNQSNEKDDCECDHKGVCAFCDENANKNPNDAFITSAATDSNQSIQDTKTAGIETLAIATSLQNGTMTAYDILESKIDLSMIPPEIPNANVDYTWAPPPTEHISTGVESTNLSNMNSSVKSNFISKYSNNTSNPNSNRTVQIYFEYNWPTYDGYTGPKYFYHMVSDMKFKLMPNVVDMR